MGDQAFENYRGSKLWLKECIVVNLALNFV